MTPTRWRVTNPKLKCHGLVGVERGYEEPKKKDAYHAFGMVLLEFYDGRVRWINLANVERA